MRELFDRIPAVNRKIESLFATVSAAGIAGLLALGTGCLSFPTSTYVQPVNSLDVEKRIAVLPFESRHANGQSMADAFVTEFMRAGFTVVDRNLVEGVAKNLGIDLSARVIEPTELAKIAEKAKLDAIVLGTINAEPEKQGGTILSVSVRMVNARSGEVIVSSTFKNEKELAPYQIPKVMMSHLTSKVKGSVKKKQKEERKAREKKAKLAAEEK